MLAIQKVTRQELRILFIRIEPTLLRSYKTQCSKFRNEGIHQEKSKNLRRVDSLNSFNLIQGLALDED